MDVNRIIIREVKKSECIYNLSHKQYKNVFLKRQMWEKIAKTTNLSADACRKRWKGLRDTYKKRKRSEQFSSSSGTTKRWKYMEVMSFLDGCNDSKPIIENISDDFVLGCSTSTGIEDISKLYYFNSNKMDVNETLIEAVRNTECIYNLSNKQYKNVLLKREMWGKIAEATNLSADACRKRWKGLRDTYKKRKRSEQFPSGSGTTKRWKYMEVMSFLDGCNDSKPIIENISDDFVLGCSTSTGIEDISKLYYFNSNKMDVNETLIEAVRNTECIYNLSNKQYKNVLLKREMWRKIAEATNLSADVCRKRWKGLRDTYKKRKRSEQFPSSSGTTKRWKYMEVMSFLDGCNDSKPNVGYVLNDALLDGSTSSSIEDICGLSSDMTDTYKREETTNKANAEVTEVFIEMMKECAGTVKVLANDPLSLAPERNSTSLLFESLAKSITESNLSAKDVRAIERKVVTLVYDELSKLS